jgi:hypothetical protein
MKSCTKCKQEKQESEFNSNSRYRGGLVSWCKSCVNLNSQEWGLRLRADRTLWPRIMLPLVKRRAKKIGVEFDLTVDDIIIPEYCPILGVPLERSVGNTANPNSPSVDRIDSTRGYVKGNIAVISYRANVIKNDGTPTEHRLVADWIDRQTK